MTEEKIRSEMAELGKRIDKNETDIAQLEGELKRLAKKGK